MNTLKYRLIIFLIAISTSLFAQEKKDKLYGGAGYFGFRISNYNLSNLNEALSASKLQEFNNLSVSFGGGGYGVINKLVIGGEGYSSVVDKKEDTSFYSSSQFESGMFQIGYVIFNNKKLFLYPGLGIGSMMQTIKIVENKENSFTEQLTNPRKGTELRVEQFLVDLSLNGNFYLSKSTLLSLNWRLGYQITGNDIQNWRDQIGNINNAPKQNYNAAYAQIGLVLGGFSR